MTPAAPALPVGSPAAPQGSPPAQQPQGRPSGGIHNSGQSAPYSLNEILALLGVAGYKGQMQARMAAIAMAESGGDPNATHTNADGSHDRGLFQINDRWHPEVSDACAYDPVCSAHQAAAIEKGSGWGAWATWTNGAAGQWLTRAEAAQRQGGWKRFQSEFAGDKLGQAGNPPQGGQQQAKPQGQGKLFDCSNGSTVLGIVPTSLPDIGCYLESMFIATTYAIGGLLLIGAGVLLLAHRNPLRMGATAVMGAAMPGKAVSGLAAQREARIAGQSERRLSLAEAESQRKAQPRPPSARVAVDTAREERLAAAQAQKAQGIETKAQAAARKLTEAKAYRERAEGYATRQRAKNPAGIGQGFSIGGKEYDVGSLVDISQRYQDELPDRMKG